MKALITGDRGFIGHALRQELENAGWTVEGLRDDGVRVDVREEESVSRVISEYQPDVLYHLGGVSGPMLLLDDLGSIIDINCRGTLNVIRSAILAGVPRIIFGASVASYAAAEDGEPVADSIYGTTKRFGELLVSYYRQFSDVQLTSVRIGAVYGEGRVTFNPIHEMVRQAKHEGVIEYNVHQAEPIITIDDCAGFLADLAQRETLDSSYDAVTELILQRDAAETIAQEFGAEIRGVEGPELLYPLGFRELKDVEIGSRGKPTLLKDAVPRIEVLV